MRRGRHGEGPGYVMFTNTTFDEVMFAGLRPYFEAEDLELMEGWMSDHPGQKYGFKKAPIKALLKNMLAAAHAENDRGPDRAVEAGIRGSPAAASRF